MKKINDKNFAIEVLKWLGIYRLVSLGIMYILFDKDIFIKETLKHMRAKPTINFAEIYKENKELLPTKEFICSGKETEYKVLENMTINEYLNEDFYLFYKNKSKLEEDKSYTEEEVSKYFKKEMPLTYEYLSKISKETLEFKKMLLKCVSHNNEFKEFKNETEIPMISYLLLSLRNKYQNLNLDRYNNGETLYYKKYKINKNDKNWVLSLNNFKNKKLNLTIALILTRVETKLKT